MSNQITLPAPELIASWNLPLLTDYRPCRWVQGLHNLRLISHNAEKPQVKCGEWTAIDFLLDRPLVLPDYLRDDVVHLDNTEPVGVPARVVYHYTTAMLLLVWLGDRTISVPLSLGWGSTSDANGIGELAPHFSMAIAYKPRSLRWGQTKTSKPRKPRPERPATISVYRPE